MDGGSAIDILDKARAAVPALDYALGAAGIAAAGAIILTLIRNGRAAIVVMGGVFVAMILLFAFSSLVSSHDVPLAIAGEILLFSVLVFFVMFLLFTVTAVAAGWPRAWADILHVASPAPAGSTLIDDLSEKIDFIVVGTNLDAVNALIGMAATSKEARKRDEIVDILKHKLSYPVTRDYDQVARPIRRQILAGIVKIRNRDISRDFANGELTNQDLVGIDMNNVDASGVDFSGSFMILSDFRNARLRGANLSSTHLRGVEFANADLAGARLTDADWFNANGLTEDTMGQVDPAGMMPCPCSAAGAYSAKSFTAFANGIYGVPFQQWEEADKKRAQAAWEIYRRPGGLCETVASLQS